jgi:hypothetical protein
MKLCCLVNKHVTCSVCKKIFCFNCWSEIYTTHVDKNTPNWVCGGKELLADYEDGESGPLILIPIFNETQSEVP